MNAHRAIGGTNDRYFLPSGRQLAFHQGNIPVIKSLLEHREVRFVSGCDGHFVSPFEGCWLSLIHQSEWRLPCPSHRQR